MTEKIETLKADLKVLRNDRNKLSKDPAGWYAIHRPQTSRGKKVPLDYCKNGKGVIRSQKEARVHILWTRSEEARLTLLINKLTKKIKREINKVETEIRTEIRVFEKSGKDLKPALAEIFERQPVPVSLKLKLWKTFFPSRPRELEVSMDITRRDSDVKVTVYRDEPSELSMSASAA